MAEVLEGKREVTGMKIDLVFLLSVDLGEVNADGCCIVGAPALVLRLMFIINEMAQIWTGPVLRIQHSWVGRLLKNTGYNE